MFDIIPVRHKGRRPNMDLTRLRKIHAELGEMLAEADAVEAAKPIVITIWHDDCPEDPSTEDGWTPYSFSTRHANHQHPDNFNPELLPKERAKEMRAKLANGLALSLDYFEHGLCTWSLSGEGPQCDFDNRSNAGILVWERDEDDIGGKTVEERRKDAALFLETYTKWCNGHVHGYTIDEHEDEPSIGGFYDFASMVGDILDHVDIEDLKRVTFKGDASPGIADEWKEALSTILSRNTAKV